MTEPIEITYRLIMELLKKRHSKDVFVPECKDGPSMSRRHVRLDAWAMRRSYSRWCLDGYEIKMTRSDFVRDEKYHLYLPACNRLWFVAPAGIIDPKELPDEAGLLTPAKTGSRFFVKKKSPYRQIEKPVRLYEYLLMSRTDIRNDAEAHAAAEIDHRRKQIERFLDGEIELDAVGYTLGEKVGQEVLKLKIASDDAIRLHGQDKQIRERLEELGLDPSRNVHRWTLDAKLRDLGLLSIGEAANALEAVRVTLERSIAKLREKETQLKEEESP